MATPPITLLHLSDTQFGRHHRFDNDRFGNHRFGNLQSTDPDEAFDTLLSRLTDDLRDLRKDHGLQPQAVLLTGDLAECGMEDEFANMLQFATGLAEALAIPRRHFAIIAGNHDINWHLCEAYFKNCTARRKEPLKPYWEKWEFYAQFFQDFYQDEPHISFTAETPWTLFAMPELKLVVAGLNSTMAESHQEKDHYGHLGEPQLRWFQEQLQQYQQQGWFRIAALHHNLRRGPIQDDENLRDFEDFKKYLGSLVNLVVHGHTHDGKADWLSNTVPILATGSAAVKVPQRPEETPNQYQIIQLGPDYYQRWTRSYYPKDKAWGGDNRATDKLDGWHKKVNVSFADIQAVFSQNPTDIPKTPASADLPEAELQRYCAALENLHRAIPLAGFKTRLRVPIDLEALYVPLSASVDLRGTGASAFADADEACAALAAHGLAQDIKLIDAFKAAQARQRRHCVLLGDPGAGKTTHLKCLLLRCLRDGTAELGLPAGTLPVFLPLRELDDLHLGIDSFIEKTLDSPHLAMDAGFGKRLLRRGRLLLLFDGLDEVSDSQQRAKVARWIEQAMQFWPDCHAVVSCRFAGYDADSRLDAEFLELHLRPLTEDQSDRFIHNWHRAVETGLNPGPAGAAQALATAEALIARLRGPDFRAARMAAMIRNPLLLANLCLVHRDRGGILPQGRHELYDECVDVLLERWRQGKGRLAVSVPAAQARRLLQPVALWLHEVEHRTRASATELASTLNAALAAAPWPGGDGRQFLRIIRDESGLLTGWSHEQFGFMHLGFQEYLAACELRRLILAEALNGQSETLQALAGRVGASWWQEVILLLLAQGNPPLFARFIEEALQQPAFAEAGAFVDLLVEEAAEPSAAPFAAFLHSADTGPATQANRAAAARVLRRLAPERADGVAVSVEDDGPASATSPPVCRSRQGDVELVLIPGGRFVMGSPPGVGEDNERPAHEVDIRPFYLGRYPITNAEYALYLQANPQATPPEYWTDRRFNQPHQPVVGVTMGDARRFAAWAGGRLPSEAEWEYAIRAGNNSQYFWGDTPAEADTYAWHRGNSAKASHPVGEKRANGFGLFDMAGNVWEWVEDAWHDDYEGAPVDGSAWGSGSSVRGVVRGGSWDFPLLDLRSCNRSRLYRGAGNYSGFRLART